MLRHDYLFESLFLKAELLRSPPIAGQKNLLLAHQHYVHAMELLDIVRNELTSREDQITLARNVYRLSSAANALSDELYESTGQHRAPGERWGSQLAGQYIQPLPETQREVTELARLFRANDRQATAYLFAEASEGNMRRAAISSCRYLHIATHGIINDEEANLSGLLLYPDSLSMEDDILAVGEVYNLQLNAELVVLSACETGIGQLATGEGVLGFSRAFLYAGAENLLVSLWKVQDDATTELMIEFYQYLLKNEKPRYADLLREAKLSLIGSEQFNHPYFWSAFILMRG